MDNYWVLRRRTDGRGEEPFIMDLQWVVNDLLSFGKPRRNKWPGNSDGGARESQPPPSSHRLCVSFRLRPTDLYTRLKENYNILFSETVGRKNITYKNGLFSCFTVIFFFFFVDVQTIVHTVWEPLVYSINHCCCCCTFSQR